MAIGLGMSIPFLAMSWSGWELAAPLFVFGGGFGFTMAGLNNVTLVDIPRSKAGIASGTMLSIRWISGSLGGALLTGVLVSTAATLGREAIDRAPRLNDDQRHHLLKLIEFSSTSTRMGHAMDTSLGSIDGSAIAGGAQDAEVQDMMLEYRRAYAQSTRLVFGIGTVLALVGAGISLLIPRHTGTKE